MTTDIKEKKTYFIITKHIYISTYFNKNSLYDKIGKIVKTRHREVIDVETDNTWRQIGYVNNDFSTIY